MKNNKDISLIMITVLFVFLQTNTILALGEPIWEPSKPLQRPRTAPGVTVGSNGLIYAIGGAGEGFGTGEITNTVERFSETTKTWEYIAPTNIERHQPGAVTDSHGCIWVVGGEGPYAHINNSVEVYDPTSNSWTLQPNSLNTERFAFGIAITENDCIYVFGGVDNNNQTLASVEKYNPNIGIWSLVHPMHEERRVMGWAVDELSRIYAIGGGIGVWGAELSSVERYDPSSDTWEYVASLPEPRESCSTFTLKNEIWVVGGNRYGYQNSCYIYSPDSDTWRVGPAMYEPLGLARAAVGASGTVYVIGGQRSIGWSSDHVAMLKPTSLDALVDVNPDSLNKNSKGQWVTVYITLPAGYDVSRIDANTIAITSLTGATCAPDYHQDIDFSFAPQIGDRDEDGIPDLTVKFNRQELIGNLCLDDVAVTVEGNLFTGEHFKGTDHIRVIDRGK